MRGGEAGMLVVETVARIRREALVKCKSIKEIARALGISRNTVRKVLRSGETASVHDRSVQPLPKLGPWSGDLDALLLANERKARRERLTLVRITRRCRNSAMPAATMRCGAMRARGGASGQWRRRRRMYR